MTLACADPGVRWAALIQPPELSATYLVPILDALIAIDILYLRKHRAPPLYHAGVRYESEGDGEEHWRSIPFVLRLGHADCKSLAAWRVAELFVAGESKVRASMSVRDLGNSKLFHVFVKRGNGQYEDPSRILGMRS